VKTARNPRDTRLRLSPTNRRGDAKTILLVEDDEAVRELTSCILQQNDFLVVEAKDAESAFRLVADRGLAADLLVSDIRLPGMNGLQLLETLRSRHPYLKAVFASGLSLAEVQERRLLPRDTIFLEKPYENVALIEVVRKILE